MALLTPPQTFRCSDCNWKMSTPHPPGDVRLPGLDHIDNCLQCGSSRIERRNASAVETTLARLRLFGRKG